MTGPLPPSGPGAADTGDGLSLMGVARTLYRRRAPALVLALGLPFLTALWMAMTPNVFTARGTILVETPESGLGSQLAGQFGMLAGLPSPASSGDVYLAILRSERVALAVSDSLDLAEHYRIRAEDPAVRRDQVLATFSRRVTFDRPDFVTIHVLARDKDPRMAAAVVNATMRELERAGHTLAFTRARKTRELVEEALASTEAELESTRVRLRDFQEEHGVVDLDTQIEATMTLIGTLQAKLLETRAEREAMLAYVQSGSAELRNLDLRIEAYRKQIDRLMGSLGGPGAAADSTGGGGDYLLEMGRVPRVAGDYARLMMDMKVQEAKYNVLATRLEQTKIEESQSIPAFEILDWARAPFRKSGPQRKLFVLAALGAGLIGGLLLAVVLDEAERRFDPATRRELVAMLPGSLGARFRGRS